MAPKLQLQCGACPPTCDGVDAAVAAAAGGDPQQLAALVQPSLRGRPGGQAGGQAGQVGKGRRLCDLAANQLAVRSSLSPPPNRTGPCYSHSYPLTCMALSVRRFMACFSALSSGTSSMCFCSGQWQGKAVQ